MFNVNREGSSADPEVYLWPTITNNEFNIALSNGEYYNILLISTMGKLERELTKCQHQTTININSISKGIYIIKVYNDHFQKTLKLIKE